MRRRRRQWREPLENQSYVRIFDVKIPAEHRASMPASGVFPTDWQGMWAGALRYFLFHLKVGIVQGVSYC